MNDIKQKTEYWMIGALQRLIRAGMIYNFQLKNEIKLEESQVNWDELDDEFPQWADQMTFILTANEMLQGLQPLAQLAATQKLATFASKNTRYTLMQMAYDILYKK